MFKVGGALVAGGFAAAMLLQSVLVVWAAPQQSSQAHASAKPAGALVADGAAPSSSPTGGAPTSLGHFYGKAVSNLAHTVPAGSQHGAVISAFAKSSNPSHTNGHRGHGAALGKAKH